MTVQKIEAHCFVCGRGPEEVELHYCEKGFVCGDCEREYAIVRTKESNSKCDSVEFRDVMNRGEGDAKSP